MTLPHRLSLILLMFALAPMARSAEFTLFIYETPEALALREGPGEATRAYWQAYADFGAQLAEAGVMRGGTALVPDSALRADGLQLGGYFVIDVASTELAQEWADRAPARSQGGRVIPVASVTSPAMPARP